MGWHLRTGRQMDFNLWGGSWEQTRAQQRLLRWTRVARREKASWAMGLDREGTQHWSPFSGFQGFSHTALTKLLYLLVLLHPSLRCPRLLSGDQSRLKGDREWEIRQVDQPHLAGWTAQIANYYEQYLSSRLEAIRWLKCYLLGTIYSVTKTE